MLLQTMLRDIMGKYAGQTAASLGSEHETYAVLRRRVDALSHALRALGCRAGCRVVYARCAGLPYLETFLASLQLGAVFCPLSPRCSPGEFLGMLRRLEPDFLLAESDLLDLIAEELPSILPRGRTVSFSHTKRFLSYDSLTRRQFVLGRIELPEESPAVAVLDEKSGQIETVSHGLLCQWLGYCRRALLHPSGVSLLCIPYTCLAYLQEICLGLVCGDELLLVDSFTPKDFIKVVAAKRVTSTYLTPSIVRAVSMDSSFLVGDFSHLRSVRCGQAYFDRATAQSLQALLPPDGVLEKHTGFPGYAAQLSLSADQLCLGDWDSAAVPINSIGRPVDGYAFQVRGADGAPLSPGCQGELFARRDGAPWEPLGVNGWMEPDGLFFLCGERDPRHLPADTSFSHIRTCESNLTLPDEAVSLELSAYLSIFDAFATISPHDTTAEFARQCCAAVMDLLPRCRAAALSIPRRSLQSSITRHYVIQEVRFPVAFPDPPSSFWVRKPGGAQPVELRTGDFPPGLYLECHPIYATGRQLLGELYLAVPKRGRPAPARRTTLLLVLRHLATLLASHRGLSEAAARMELYQKAIELAGDGIGISGLEAKPVLIFVNSKSARFINLGKTDPDFGAQLEEIQTANFQDLRQGGTNHSSRSFFYNDAAHGKTWVNYRAERVLVDGEPYAIAYCNMREVGSGGAHLEGLLSARELEIVRLLTEGLTNKEIAFRLDISVNTVKFHVARIYKKMQVTNRAELLSSTFLRKS